MNNPPCQCGHCRDWHVKTDLNLWEQCDGCLSNHQIPYHEICRLFKLDNLKYLEMVYDKKQEVKV